MRCQIDNVPCGTIMVEKGRDEVETDIVRAFIGVNALQRSFLNIWREKVMRICIINN